MMRRPGQQVKSLPVIYVIDPFLAGILATPVSAPTRWPWSVTRFAAGLARSHP